MKRYLVFAAVGMTLLASTISVTAVAVAFPNIIASFNTSLIVAGWVLSASILAGTVGMALLGKIGDAYGNKSAFMLCICLFTSGSLLCALAPNIETLIVFRFIQGFGTGGFLPVGTSIIADQFRDRRQQSIGLLTSVFAAGQLIGPNLGGWLTTAFGWQSNFWIFVPYGILALIVILFLVPRTGGTASKLDFAGAGFLTAILSAIMVGISLMGNTRQGISWIQVGLFLSAGVILAVVFLRRQAKIKNPIIDIEILKEKRFVAANVYNFVLGSVFFAPLSFIPLYAVSIFGLSTFQSGFVLTPRSGAVIAASIVASMYLVRWGYRKPMLTGTVVVAVSLIILSIINPDTVLFGWPINGFLIVSLVLFMSGIAQGVTLPAANNACIELMPEKVGTITGVRGMFRNIGCVISTGVFALALNNSSNMQQGFFLALLASGIISLLSLPLIFIIPKNACVAPIKKA